MVFAPGAGGIRPFPGIHDFLHILGDYGDLWCFLVIFSKMEEICENDIFYPQIP